MKKFSKISEDFEHDNISGVKDTFEKLEDCNISFMKITDMDIEYIQKHYPTMCKLYSEMIESGKWKILGHPYDTEGNTILFDTETNDIFQLISE